MLLLDSLSTLLHLIWNSLVFASFPVSSYPTALVASNWRESSNNSWRFAPLPPPDTLDNYNLRGDWDCVLDMRAQLPSFTRLDWAACLARFADHWTAKAPTAVVALNAMSRQHNQGYPLLHGWASYWAGGCGRRRRGGSTTTIRPTRPTGSPARSGWPRSCG